MTITKLEKSITAVGIAVKGNPIDGGKFEETEYTIEELKTGQVLVKITATSICHTDFQCFKTDGAVPGHEMCGKIEAMADDVKELEIGQRVAIGWQRSSCRDCEYCKKGDENLCENKTSFQQGKAGWASYVVWDAHFVTPVPDCIDDTAVAPLMCAGTTVFNAFKQNGVKKGDKVAVVSIGGLGHLGLMIAHKMGCEVTAISRGTDKKGEAEGFGADEYIDSKNEEQIKAAKKKFDFMLVTTPADLDCDMYAKMVRPQDGVMCFVGVPPSMKFTFGISPIIGNNIKITGSLIASPETTKEMLQFCSDNDVKPTIERFEFNADAFLKAVKKVKDNEIRFRAVMVL